MKTYPTQKIKRHVFISFLFSILALSAESQINFQNITFEEASLQEKNILVSYTAEWCLPCKLMDETIFSNQKVVRLVNENFVSIKADIDSEKGKEWNDLYNINYLPASLFASKAGKELE